MDVTPHAFAELPLLVWLSPAFPVGGFAYSHGLESAVEAGLVADADSLRGWIADLVARGSIRQDAILLAAAWRGAADAAVAREVNDMALALSPARERRLETAAMGNAFAATIRASWPALALAEMEGTDLAYPVAIGLTGAAQGLALEPMLAAFGMAFVASLVSAAVRLGPIGQTDGQRVTAALIGPVRAMARAAASATLDDLGGCAFRSDLAAMHHETQYSRLFRS